MKTLPLIFQKGHLYFEIDGELWLIDTGCPSSFGESHEIILNKQPFQLGKEYFGLTAEKISQFTGVECSGIIGADILGNFDFIFDIPEGTAAISTDELEHDGEKLSLSFFMGIPILQARINNSEYQMFFDTGAQISYFQDDTITNFPSAGTITDFYPMVGQFQTESFMVPIELGNGVYTLRCGTLPNLLGVTLQMAGTSGIIGNQIMENKVIGYFPRRNLLSL